MNEQDFKEAIRELRGEWTAPSEVAEVTARLFEEMRAEIESLRTAIRGGSQHE